VGTMEDEHFAGRCEALRTFLTSSGALSLLGEDDALEAFKEFLSKRQQELNCPRQAWVDCEGSSGSTPYSWTASMSALSDVLVPLAADGNPVDYTHATTQAPLEAWTVRSLVGPALLRRQDFTCAADAWAAFSAVTGLGVPCVIRNPAGVDVDSRSWLVVDRIAGSVLKAPVAVPSLSAAHAAPILTGLPASSLNGSRHASPRARRHTVTCAQDAHWATPMKPCPAPAIMLTPQFARSPAGGCSLRACPRQG
jgi:hypothetical protein